MIIPDTIQLGGLTITTVYMNDLVPADGVYGTTDYKGQKIILYTKGMHHEHLCQLYIHELTHWILFVMNEHKLKNNEKFVDLFAHFYYQFAKELINVQTKRNS